MTSSRKPFQSIAPDIDDAALEAVARAKGVPSLLRSEPGTPPRATEAIAQAGSPPDGQGASRLADETDETIAIGPTPRNRMAYVKACLPDYALVELKTRAVIERVSVNHILLKALCRAGIDIKPDDLIEDGRRLRGNKV